MFGREPELAPQLFIACFQVPEELSSALAYFFDGVAVKLAMSLLASPKAARNLFTASLRMGTLFHEREGIVDGRPLHRRRRSRSSTHPLIYHNHPFANVW